MVTDAAGSDHEVVYREVAVKTALNPLKRRIPYRWDLNIYRGCEHDCCYCYARGASGHPGAEAFRQEVQVKTNIVEVLEKELSAPGWQREVINIGGVTDSYQPAEERYRLMPEILKLMIKYRNPVIISSKSALVLRDFDLLASLARITYVNIAQTIVTADQALANLIEPGAAQIEDRFSVLKAFAPTGASTGLHLMPILPALTDSSVNLEDIVRRAAGLSVDYLLPGVLYLRGAARSHYLDFIRREFPAQYRFYCSLYPKGSAGPDYKAALYSRLNPLRQQYGVSASYMKPMKERLGRQE